MRGEEMQSDQSPMELLHLPLAGFLSLIDGLVDTATEAIPVMEPLNEKGEH